jgi:hypothetical protein
MAELPADAPLFTVPAGLVRILDRDLVAAGIARRVEVRPGEWKIDKRDDRGRTVDIHALRHTFGTLLSKAGVSPRTAQAAMRHSTVDLTMNVYTDPRLLDVAGAVESLPRLTLSGGGQRDAIAAKSTGTKSSSVFQFAPEFAPTTGKSGLFGSILGTRREKDDRRTSDPVRDVKSCPVKHKSPSTTWVNGLCSERETGFEPATSSLGSSWMEAAKKPLSSRTQNSLRRLRPVSKA